MKFMGERMYKLSDMERGKMYVIVQEEFVDYHSRTPKEQAYAFVYLEKIVHEKEMLNNSNFQEITYMCDLINAPDGESEFKLFETIDQEAINEEKTGLYSLVQI